MKKLLAFLFSVTVFSACSKDGDDDPASNSFSASIGGMTYTFTLESATLLRSTATNQKRLDIAGVSTTGTIKLIITFGEETSVGNGMSTKNYTVRLFNEDDPSTPADESADSDDGFITFGTSLGSSWLYGVYSENGLMKITGCNESSTTVSGSFQGELVDLNDNTVMTITNGQFNNIKYQVVN